MKQEDKPLESAKHLKRRVDKQFDTPFQLTTTLPHTSKSDFKHDFSQK